MRQLALFFFVPFVAIPAFSQDAEAPSGRYVADIAHTSLHWRIRHFGLSNYTARFTGIEAKLDWNSDDPAQSVLVVSIDPRSVETDFPFVEQEDFDKTIGTAEHMLADKPIEFRSTRIAITGENTAIAHGDLTLRGQTHPVELKVVFNGSMAKHPMDGLAELGFSATTTIRRSQWSLDFALDALSDEVELIIESEFVPAQPER